MSAFTFNSFSRAIRRTHNEFVMRRVEGLRRVSYRRPLHVHVAHPQADAA